MTVIAYSYDADHHCEACMLDYARKVEYKDYVWDSQNGKDPDNDRYHSQPGILYLPALVEDEIIRDSENNPIHPVFSTDEWYNIGEGNQTLSCTDCGEVIEEYDDED